MEEFNLQASCARKLRICLKASETLCREKGTRDPGRILYTLDSSVYVFSRSKQEPMCMLAHTMHINPLCVLFDL